MSNPNPPGKAFDLVFKEIPIKIPDHYRLDGMIGRKYCALLFPIGFPNHQAQKIIRRRLGMLPEDWTER